MRKIQEQINKRVSGLMAGYKKPYSNITQNLKFVNINVELPNVKKKNIIVDVNDDRIVVRAEKSSGTSKKSKSGYSETENYIGFYRAIGLPKGVDIHKTKAKFSRDVLKIRIPKRDISKRVSVK